MWLQYINTLLHFGDKTTLPKEKQNGIILHAFCWSFQTIKQNMRLIADAGYTMVQTSPANKCFFGENGGMEIFGEGKWFYHYQPIEWSIGNYQLGTKKDFISMTKEARKYGITILVDVVPNHTAFKIDAVSDEFIQAVGGKEKLYHANGLKPIEDYNDRLQCTTCGVGGLPDVNTENPNFQHYFMKYINDLIACGAGGFRYDTAKHIGLPSDPKDKNSSENNFWQIATGQESIKGVRLNKKKELFIYGEVLQDENVKEKEYSLYMGVTASSYGEQIRKLLNRRSSQNINLEDWKHPANPKQLITWVESHDTYCNEGISADLTDQQIRCGWSIITARDSGVPLFFSRPNGSDSANRWGYNHIGERGNANFYHPEIIAVNKFRQKVKGKSEKIYYSTDKKVIEICRGKKGAVLVNIGDTKNVKIETDLKDGLYKDEVYQTCFKVKNGFLTAYLEQDHSYVVLLK